MLHEPWTSETGREAGAKGNAKRWGAPRLDGEQGWRAAIAKAVMTVVLRAPSKRDSYAVREMRAYKKEQPAAFYRMLKEYLPKETAEAKASEPESGTARVDALLEELMQKYGGKDEPSQDAGGSEVAGCEHSRDE